LNPDDNVSKKNTVENLQLNKGKMSLNKLLKRITKEHRRCKGYLNEKKEGDKFDNTYFGDTDLMSENDYKTNYTTYKKGLYKDWNFPYTVSDQQKQLKEWREELFNCEICEDKWQKDKEKDKDLKRPLNDCEVCKDLIHNLTHEPVAWKAGCQIAHRRYIASQPSLARGIKHIKDDEWQLKIEFMGYNKRVKTEFLTVDTAFVKRRYGSYYTKFVRLLPMQVEKNSGLFQSNMVQ